MSSKQYLTDAAIKHQVFLLRYAGSTYKQMARFIEDAKTETLNLLANANTAYGKERFTTLLTELSAMNKAIYKDMASGVKDSMTNLATYEADFTQRMFNRGTDIPFETVVPTTAQITSAAFTNVMDATPGFMPINGVTVGDALKDFGVNTVGDIVKAVRVGFALGQTNDEIATAITTITDAVADRQALSLARTITNHVASNSRMEFYKENSNVLTNQYQVVATLDDATCETCAALDGEIFDASDFEEPPYHWNCRCTFIAVVDDKYSIDLGGKRPAQDPDGGYDTVSTKTSYNDWIKAQPDSFQNEVLGNTHADLLRAGMDVQGFVDKNYAPLTLDELRSKDDNHIFFKKAGL